MTKPAWLPEIISVDGAWQDVCARLYAVFEQDFVKAGRTFEGRPIWWDRHVQDGKYEEGFWHLISKDDQITKERLFDSRRAERLPWCGPAISNSKNAAIKVWDYKEGGRKIRTFLWLESFDYLIVMEKRKIGQKEIVFLITAYYVEGESTRRKLRRKYAERLV